jgi:hypothetical protein
VIDYMDLAKSTLEETLMNLQAGGNITDDPPATFASCTNSGTISSAELCSVGASHSN